MTRRWRPSLGFVLGGALCGTLALSLIGLVVFRYVGPEFGFRNSAFVLAVVIAVLTSVLGWLLVRLLLRPITALERYAAQVRAAPKDRADPPAHFGTKELYTTAQSVIEMANTLRNRETTIRSFTDHVTHEIKTPVSAIRAAVELLEDGQGLSDADRRLVTQIAGAGEQIEGQLDALRRAARAREVRHIGETKLADLRAALAADHPDLTVQIDGAGIAIPLAAEGLGIVLGHLLSNSQAHDATEIALAVTDDAEHVTLSVTDNGAGISDGNRTHVFEPFFTTKRDQGGTGMGLPIIRNIINAHGGEITLIPSGTGAAFQIRFPIG
ncbi:sensor histidine kinase [Aliiroseovarius sp. YM-037]|uniref:sensor histidine kinase n=1 Tax=Aliiroseovarius sp. YM-037 TaxID=3341728 RepID=UPI003A7F7EDC